MFVPYGFETLFGPSFAHWTADVEPLSEYCPLAIHIQYIVLRIPPEETSVLSCRLPDRCPRMWLTCVPSAIAANRILVDSQTQGRPCDAYTITSTLMVYHSCSHHHKYFDGVPFLLTPSLVL